jgi:hypothetical protein
MQLNRPWLIGPQHDCVFASQSCHQKFDSLPWKPLLAIQQAHDFGMACFFFGGSITSQWLEETADIRQSNATDCSATTTGHSNRKKIARSSSVLPSNAPLMFGSRLGRIENRRRPPFKKRLAIATPTDNDARLMPIAEVLAVRPRHLVRR